MAKLKIVGITENKGVYQEINYRNLILNLHTSDDNTIGDKVETAKIKWKNLDDVFGLDVPEGRTCDNYFKLTDFSNLIGRTCHIYYDKYRNVEQVIVDELPTSKTVDNKPVK